MQEIKNTLVSAFENYPVESGLLIMGIGIILVIFRLEKKNTFKMKDYGLIEWKLLVQTWGIAIMFILIAIILILKNI
tara:strand:- start:3881 stop:4111 length:231 start_codon:yes stop_codon:yes gene_type:complete